MMNIKNPNFFFFKNLAVILTVLTIFCLGDFISTAIALANGAVELNIFYPIIGNFTYLATFTVLAIFAISVFSLGYKLKSKAIILSGLIIPLLWLIPIINNSLIIYGVI